MGEMKASGGAFSILESSQEEYTPFKIEQAEDGETPLPGTVGVVVTGGGQLAVGRSFDPAAASTPDSAAFLANLKNLALSEWLTEDGSLALGADSAEWWSSMGYGASEYTDPMDVSGA